jgi:hypothetical protein
MEWPDQGRAGGAAGGLAMVSSSGDAEDRGGAERCRSAMVDSPVAVPERDVSDIAELALDAFLPPLEGTPS